MQYLLDSNVLIDASRDYYPISKVPEFWEWLVFKGQEDLVKVPVEIYEEIEAGTGELTDWTKSQEFQTSLLLKEEVEPSLVSEVIDRGYAPDLRDDEVEKIGHDPFLIAYAMAPHVERCIVTTESSKPTKVRANRRVPDVCGQFSIECCHTFQFIRVLNFHTGWKSN